MGGLAELNRVARLFFSWAVLLLAVSAPGVYCDDDSVDRMENGEERGPNSKLAMKVERYVQILIGGALVVALLGYCWCNVRKARKSIAEEEEANVEGVKDKKAASVNPNWRADPERITRGHPEQYADLPTASKRNFHKDDTGESHDRDVKDATSPSELPGGVYNVTNEPGTHLV